MVGYSYVDNVRPLPKYQNSPGTGQTQQNTQLYDLFMDKLLRASMANGANGYGPAHQQENVLV